MDRQMEAEVPDLVQKVRTQVQGESRKGFAEDPA